jgi:hypothetical protein
MQPLSDPDPGISYRRLCPRRRARFLERRLRTETISNSDRIRVSWYPVSDLNR